MQGDCIIIQGQRKASTKAEEGRERLMQSHVETKTIDTEVEGVFFASFEIA